MTGWSGAKVVRRWAAQAGAGVALAGLSACGGGSGSGSVAGSDSAAVGSAAASGAAAAVAAVPVVVPSTLTTPDYLRLRAQRAAPTGLVPPEASVAARWLADQHRAAALQVGSGLAATDNRLVVPALTVALHRVLSAAATGQSLAQLVAAADPAPPAAVQAWQTGQVQLQAWTQQGAPLATAFWQRIDPSEAGNTWATWQAAEARFDQAVAPDLGADFRALPYADAEQTRLLLRQRLVATVNWPGLTPEAGLFELGPRDLLSVQLLRLRSGVRGFDGDGYRADLLSRDGVLLLALRPQAGTALRDFAATRLAPALTEAVASLLTDTGTSAARVSDGQLLLPAGSLILTLDAADALRQAGVQQVFDKVQANLKGLDAQGGTYAQVQTPAPTFQLDASGFRLAAEQQLAFTFSPANVNGPAYGAISNAGQFGGFSPGVNLCAGGGPVWPAADLSPFFLAVLNPQGWVQALIAMNKPVGTPYTPPCPDFVPWGEPLP